MKDYRSATVVAVGNDFDLSYKRLTAAARAAARGAPLVTPNVDPRLPVEGGEFLPGCGSIVEAVAVAAGVRPIVVGKPEPPLFQMALAAGAAAGGDGHGGRQPRRDIRGGQAAGMPTVLYAPDGVPDLAGGRRPLVRRAGALPGSDRPESRGCTLAGMFDIGFQEIL